MMDRRALIAGAVTLPLLPATGTAAQPANATDALWPEYLAAKAAAHDMDRDPTMGDDEITTVCRRLHAAEDAVHAAPVATLTDVQRKLAIYSNWNGAFDIDASAIDAMLAQVRAATGRNV